MTFGLIAVIAYLMPTLAIALGPNDPSDGVAFGVGLVAILGTLLCRGALAGAVVCLVIRALTHTKPVLPPSPNASQRPPRRLRCIGNWITRPTEREKSSMTSQKVMMAMVGATMAATLAISGCSHDTTPSSASTASKPPTPVDNTTLLMNPADIVLPGQTFTTAKAPQGFPTGAAVAYLNSDQSLVIDDRIILAPDAATAEKAFEAGKTKIANALPGTTMTDVPVGQGAAMGVATWKNGTKLANTVIFHEGTAVATMEFDSPVNAPFPQGFPVAIAQKQDAAIKSGLPG